MTFKECECWVLCLRRGGTHWGAQQSPAQAQLHMDRAEAFAVANQWRNTRAVSEIRIYHWSPVRGLRCLVQREIGYISTLEYDHDIEWPKLEMAVWDCIAEYISTVAVPVIDNPRYVPCGTN